MSSGFRFIRRIRTSKKRLQKRVEGDAKENGDGKPCAKRNEHGRKERDERCRVGRHEGRRHNRNHDAARSRVKDPLHGGRDRAVSQNEPADKTRRIGGAEHPDDDDEFLERRQSENFILVSSPRLFI